jgi:hypothetical protein
MMPVDPGAAGLPPLGLEQPVSSQASNGNPPGPSGPVFVPPPVYRWYHKMWAVLLITFCLEIGLFLLIFPWTDFWQGNYFSVLVPEWHQYWDNLYLRGAVSGLGVANLYISVTEIFRLRRFSRP